MLPPSTIAAFQRRFARSPQKACAWLAAQGWIDLPELLSYGAVCAALAADRGDLAATARVGQFFTLLMPTSSPPPAWLRRYAVRVPLGGGADAQAVEFFPRPLATLVMAVVVGDAPASLLDTADLVQLTTVEALGGEAAVYAFFTGGKRLPGDSR